MLKICHSTLPARLAPRKVVCNKGDFGAVGVVGGAAGTVGAALLAARAALLCGAGRVFAGLLDERVAVDAATPELMLTLPDQAMALPSPACLVAGPGLGQSGAARHWLEKALTVPQPLLLDADALNLLARDEALVASLAVRRAPTLITPHPGEAARLLRTTAAEVQANRHDALLALSQRCYASVVLKGPATLVLGEDGIPWRNTTGNPGMAAPGMGDVLCGIIAALAAQGMSLDHAAVVGVWLHGAAGDKAASQKRGPVGLTASEVAQAARDVLNASLA
ncbi:MAG: NAD(P)H-hydrate dehydratase [Thiobacillus sp.]|nr:NAD(P)H-hydrate dehydratase [Thiobacillus sp.]